MAGGLGFRVLEAGSPVRSWRPRAGRSALCNAGALGPCRSWKEKSGSSCSAEGDGALRGKPCCVAGSSKECAGEISEQGLPAGHEFLKLSLK